MRRGWFLESYRHALSARGVRTKRSYLADNLSFTRGLRKSVEGVESGVKTQRAVQRAAREKEIALRAETLDVSTAPLSAAERERAGEEQRRLRQSEFLQGIRLRQDEQASLRRQFDDLRARAKLIPSEKKFTGVDTPEGLLKFENDAKKFLNDVAVLQEARQRSKSMLVADPVVDELTGKGGAEELGDIELAVEIAERKRQRLIAERGGEEAREQAERFLQSPKGRMRAAMVAGRERLRRLRQRVA